MVVPDLKSTFVLNSGALGIKDYVIRMLCQMNGQMAYFVAYRAIELFMQVAFSGTFFTK